METLQSLQHIFNDVQICDSKKFKEHLSQTLMIIPQDNSFLRIIDILLLSQKTSFPPKIFYFLKRLFEELSVKNRSIFDTIVLYVFDKITCKNSKIRKNSLKLINLFVSVDPNCLNSDLLMKIAEKIFDKEVNVRREALKTIIPYQNYQLNESVTVQTTLKDVIRYDPSNEIRKMGFLGLELCDQSLNCILERCIDSDLQIRKAFWFQYFSKIDISKLTYPQKIYLLKKSMNERDFDAKSIFINRAIDYGIESYIEQFYCEEDEFGQSIEMILQNTVLDYELTRYTPAYLYFIYFYYRFKEEKDGRDSLKLVDLNEFLRIFYIKCTESESMQSNGYSNDEISQSFKVLKYCLKILAFYDIFTDHSKKCVLSIINHLILHPSFNQIVEDCIVLAIRICDSNIINFIGSLIKKTKNKPICIQICEFAMKHLPYGEIFDAIMTEIAILDISRSHNLFFWYLTKNYNDHIAEQYLSYLPVVKVLEGVTDLILSGLMTVDKVQSVIEEQLSFKNTSAVIPTCKLLLADKLNNCEYVKTLLSIYYSTEVESTQQYLSVFFYEYFRIYPNILISIFCDVLELIPDNHKVFIDQTLFWISNSKAKNNYQQLYYNICVYLLQNYHAIQDRKHLFKTLFKIQLSDDWEPVLVKKLIVFLSQILRKRPRENVHLLLNQLVEMDDGVPLSYEEYEQIRYLVEK